MATKHWSKEDLVNHLYGVGPDNDHLGDCRECRDRWLELSQAKRALPVEPVDAAFLAQQRGAILRRIEQPGPRFGWRWVPALAATAALGVGVWFAVPEKPVDLRAPAMSASDVQLLREVSITMEDPEPRAASPIRELFTDPQ